MKIYYCVENTIYSVVFISCCIAFSIIFMISNFCVAANWSPLPDTGQTQCYDVSGNIITCPSEGQPLHGQDAQYDSSLLSYTDNNNGTVTDNNTGLVWLQTDDGVERNREEAINYCESLSFANITDWRLPKAYELLSIVDYGRSLPSIDPVFQCTSSPYYYMTTTLWLNHTAVHTVSFIGGGSATSPLDTKFYVRCVSGDI